MVEPEDAARLRLAVEAARDAAAKRRAALLAAESALPGAARRPEANYGERWEAEEALATVRGAAGASAARALGLAHPDAARPGDDRAAPAPTAIPDPAERGVHDAPRRRSLRALEDPSEEEPPPSSAAARATPFWVETIDGDTGAAYYFDPETRETRWDRPENARIVPDERAAAAEAKPTHPSNGVAGTHPGTDQAGPGTDHPSPDPSLLLRWTDATAPLSTPRSRRRSGTRRRFSSAPPPPASSRTLARPRRRSRRRPRRPCV